MKIKSIVTVFLLLNFCGLIFCLYRRHYYVNERMSWKEAQQYCRLHHDDLSTISSSDENSYIPVTWTSLCSNDSDYYSVCYNGRWIGLYRDTSSSSVWKWSGGRDTSFRMWARKQPNEDETMKCVYAHAVSNEWYNASCSLNLTFFCMEESPKLILVQQNKTWEEALDYCRIHYTDLASLLSDDEMHAAVNKSQAALSTNVWIGLHFVDRYWIWMDGNALKYQAWSGEGPPQCPAANLRCGALETEEKIWAPRDCEENNNFLCLRKWNNLN